MVINIIREIDNPTFGMHFVIEKGYDEIRKASRFTYGQMQELYHKYKSKLEFSPLEYKLFDGNVVDYLNDYPGYLGGIHEPGNKHYKEFEAVRQNTVMVRMAIYQHLFPEGYIFKDAADKTQKMAILREVGTALGATLKHESRIRFFTNLFNFSKVPLVEKRFGRFGIEHIGAAALYKRLLRKQNKTTLNPLNWLMGRKQSHHWSLPPIEETVLSHHDIQEAVFSDSHQHDIGVDAPATHLAAEAKIIFETIFNQGTNPVRVNPHRRPQTLNDEEAEEAVILGHRIIDNWKIINASTDKRTIDEIDHKNRDLEKSELLAELALTYDKVIADMSARYPEMLTQDAHDIFSNARLALGKLGYLTLLRSIEACGKQDDGNLQHELLYIEEKKIPQIYKDVELADEAALMAQIEQAFKAAQEYRAMRQARKQQTQDVPLSADAALRLNARLIHNVGQMHHKISHDSAHIGAANTWAVPAVKAMQEEMSIVEEQKRLVAQYKLDHSTTRISAASGWAAPAAQALHQKIEIAQEQSKPTDPCSAQPRKNPTISSFI